jgi:hypothetical protein
MASEWYFEPLSLSGMAGTNVAGKNFSRESKSIASIFCREFNQNVLDARCDDTSRPGKKAVARIIISLKQISEVDKSYLEAITDELEPHLGAAGHPLKVGNWENDPTLIIEEFNTVGLTGITEYSHDHSAGNRWNNFWFGEALENTKGRGANGGRGQGKITYHITSGCRAVFALTRRNDDPEDYIFGKCIVEKSHMVSGTLYPQHGFWPKNKKEVSGLQPVPEKDASLIKQFKTAFGLAREEETGTSWVIPFVPPAMNKETLVGCFVTDFFTTIMLGRLTLNVCGEEINAGNVREVVKKYKITAPSQEFFTFMEKATKTPKSDIKFIYDDELPRDELLNEKDINTSTVEKIRKKYRAGDLLSIKLPLKLERYDGSKVNSFVEVHLQHPEPLAKTEQLYVRSDLQISDEKHLKAQGVFGLVVADDLEISEFLGSCEEASHLKWNQKEGQQQKIYKAVSAPLSKVRNSLPALYRLVVGSGSDLDKDALSHILSIPLPSKGTKKIKPRIITPHYIRPIIPRSKKKVLFRYDSTAQPGCWVIKPGKDIDKANFPIEAEFSFAYDRMSGNGDPFKKYLVWDFDLADSKHSPIKTDVKILVQQENILKIEIYSENFELTIPGFSTDCPLCSRRQK